MEATNLISSISTTQLTPLLDGDASLYMLDVRDSDEVADWHIPGAHNIPLDELSSRVNEVPRDKHLVLVCAKGARALQGATFLAEAGVASEVLDGGMTAWAKTYDVVEETFGGVKVVQVRRRGKGCLSYVIGAQHGAVVIDPSLDVEHYIAVAQENGWSITHILDTHLHADHISGARKLRDLTGGELWLNPADPFTFNFEPLKDGKSIEIAPDVNLTVASVSVPGHTEGSTMYQLGDFAIFTGDTLFLESVGRPDLADQVKPFAHHLFASLHERVLPLSDEILVFPAHFGAGVPVSSRNFVAKPLGDLRHALTPLTLNEEEFVDWAVANVKDRPPNYKEIVRINTGQKAFMEIDAELELGPNRCAIA